MSIKIHSFQVSLSLKRAQKIISNLYDDGFTAVSLDESFFFFDSIVRKVWIERSSGPIVSVTHSHRHSCLFGSINING
jgi:hypothetical protein